MGRFAIYTALVGVINTGDAVAADVVSGKTFSSSLLTNSTGTNINPTVPGNAVITPKQAFVDFLTRLTSTNWLTATAVDLSDIGCTALGSNILGLLFSAAENQGIDAWDFSGNALPAAQVNAILAYFVAHASAVGITPGTIDLSGGTNQAPTGQGDTDQATLEGGGWVITVTP